MEAYIGKHCAVVFSMIHPVTEEELTSVEIGHVTQACSYGAAVSLLFLDAAVNRARWRNGAWRDESAETNGRTYINVITNYCRVFVEGDDNFQKIVDEVCRDVL